MFLHHLIGWFGVGVLHCLAACTALDGSKWERNVPPPAEVCSAGLHARVCACLCVRVFVRVCVCVCVLVCRAAVCYGDESFHPSLAFAFVSTVTFAGFPDFVNPLEGDVNVHCGPGNVLSGLFSYYE